jgi:hypothetical protein
MNAVASCTRRTLVTAMAVLIAGVHGLFGAKHDPGGALADGGRKHGGLEPIALPRHRAPGLPAFPDQPVDERVAASLQGVIDEAVDEFGGSSAAVIVGGVGALVRGGGDRPGEPVVGGVARPDRQHRQDRDGRPGAAPG